VGIVFLLLVHEMGHVVAAKMLGLPVSLPMFIPFFGAFTALQEAPADAWTMALFATGGPLLGGIVSWLVMLLGFHFGAPWLIAVASVGFVLNIFNMIPVPPFDGGTMCAAISTWFWFVGLLLLGVVLIYFHSLYTSIFIILIVFFMTLPRLQQTFLQEPTEEMQAYYATHISNRLMMSLIYLGILAGLVLGYGHASGFLTSTVLNNHSTGN
jgi:Zn-dependent protease